MTKSQLAQQLSVELEVPGYAKENQYVAIGRKHGYLGNLGTATGEDAVTSEARKQWATLKTEAAVLNQLIQRETGQLFPKLGRHPVNKLRWAHALLFFALCGLGCIAEIPLAAFTLLESGSVHSQFLEKHPVMFESISTMALIVLVPVIGFATDSIWVVVEHVVRENRKPLMFAIPIATVLAMLMFITSYSYLRSEIFQKARLHESYQHAEEDLDKLPNNQVLSDKKDTAKEASDEANRKVASTSGIAFGCLTLTLFLFAPSCFYSGHLCYQTYKRHAHALGEIRAAEKDLHRHLADLYPSGVLVEEKTVTWDEVQLQREYVEDSLRFYRVGLAYGAAERKRDYAQLPVFARAVAQIRVGKDDDGNQANKYDS